METLLIVAIVLIALAIIVQAGVLVGMYLMSRRLASKAETLMNESQRLMAPMESVTSNLKTVADDLSVAGKIVREEAIHVQEMTTETHQLIRGQIAEIGDAFLDTFDEARDVVMSPVRRYAAMASAVAEGVRTFFSGREKTSDMPTEDRNSPAA